MNRRAMLSCVAVLMALVAAACGSSNPASPAEPGAVAIQGVVLGASAAADLHASSNAWSAGGGKITVTLAGTNLTTTVSASGTFEMNVPAGTFTLVFQSNGVEIGRVDITAGTGSEVKIVVQVQSSTITVVEIKVETKETENETKTCLVSGGKVGQGIELEGNVSAGTFSAFQMAVNGERSSGLVDVSASAASFKCNGSKNATDAECKASVTPGAKVHVRGTLMACTLSAAQVTAAEVKLQKD